MAVLIGHASVDENKRVSGGIAGDQTGKEVCTRTWYNKPWDFVLRCKDSTKAELMARACEAGCNNYHIGYDQNQRNTLHGQAITCGYDLSRISVDCECDCSSFMAVCAECAGIGVPYSGTNAPTTRTMKSAFLATGLFELLGDSKYLSSDKYLKRGDILVKSGSHTAMVLQNGTGAQDNASIVAYPTLRYGDRNAYVLSWQKFLNLQGYTLEEDSIFGKKTLEAVKNWQTVNGLEADGIIGKNTWKTVR